MESTSIYLPLRVLNLPAPVSGQRQDGMVALAREVLRSLPGLLSVARLAPDRVSKCSVGLC